MTRILFVCIGNCCRSQMAEGFARALGKDVCVCGSAGLAPTSRIDQATMDAMAEREISLAEQFPKQFEPAMSASCDYLINLSGFDLPPVPGPVVLQWEVKDPYCDTDEVYRQVRDTIEAGVVRVVDALKRGEPLTQELIGPFGDPAPTRKPSLLDRLLPWR